jgi:hypothetical protein
VQPPPAAVDTAGGATSLGAPASDGAAREADR